MPPEPADSLDRLSHAEVLAFARGLLAEMLELRATHQDLRRDFAELKVEHQKVRDELARVKKFPPRPSIKPSGMEKATSGEKPEGKSRQPDASKQGRGPWLGRLKITATVVVAWPPSALSPMAGSRWAHGSLKRNRA